MRLTTYVHLRPKREAISPIRLHHVFTDNSAFTVLPAFLVEKWHWCRLFSRYPDFSIPVSFHQCFRLIHLSTAYTTQLNSVNNILKHTGPMPHFLWCPITAYIAADTNPMMYSQLHYKQCHIASSQKSMFVVTHYVEEQV